MVNDERSFPLDSPAVTHFTLASTEPLGLIHLHSTINRYNIHYLQELLFFKSSCSTVLNNAIKTESHSNVMAEPDPEITL